MDAVGGVAAGVDDELSFSPVRVLMSADLKFQGEVVEDRKRPKFDFWTS